MRSALFVQQNPGSLPSIVNAGVFPGAVLFVDSSNTAASDTAGNGISPDAPLATLKFALTQCTASKGDTIILMPGHAESVVSAAMIAINVAGVRIIGLGKGAKRATFTYTTLTTATITITAADIHIENVVFKNGIDALANMLTISGADCTLQDVEINDNSASFACTNAIVTTAAADRLRILDHVHRGYAGKTGAVSQISIVGGADIVIKPKWMAGDCSTANILNATTAATNLQVFGSGDFPAYLRNLNASCVIVTVHANTTGRQGPNLNARLLTNAANITEAFVGAKCEFFQPINIVNNDGESSMQTNITASTDA